MKPITIIRNINAPMDLVFRTVADVSKFAETVPHIARIEFLTDVKYGPGTRFRETRLMRGKPYSTELEVTELVENDYVRIVADNHGTVWDTIFSVKPENGQTTLTMVMDGRTNKLLGKVMNFLIRGMISKEVAKDMDIIKQHCESQE